jgi:hypothetical protein
MVCLSSFTCPQIFSLYTSLGSICGSQPSEEVGYLVTKESLYSGAMGIPTASPAPTAAIIAEEKDPLNGWYFEEWYAVDTRGSGRYGRRSE